MSQEVWSQATIPLKLVGLGLRDPVVLGAAARLAALTNAESFALELGADVAYVQREKDEALRSYQRQVGSAVSPELEPSKELQGQLTLPIHLRRVDALVRAAEGPDKQRLSSLGTPHSTTWSLATPLVKPPTATDFRWALRWTLGLPLREGDYACPFCGARADSRGVHAVCCQRTGDITRSHNFLRDTVRDVLVTAGYTVLKEQPLPKRSELRPADLLVLGYGPRPLAIDFTVITPVRPSAAPGPPGSLMDSAARAKCRKYKKACDDEGWDFMPFVADTFGAVRSDARSFVGTIIQRTGEAFTPLLPHEAGQAIWSAVSGAAVHRAASQLSRAALTDNPADMPLALLDLTSVRALRAPVNEAAGTPQPQPKDMGTSTHPLPSPLSVAAGSPMAPDRSGSEGLMLDSVLAPGSASAPASRELFLRNPGLAAAAADGVLRGLFPEV